MDPDEVLVLVGSLAVAWVAGLRWYGRLFSAGPPYSAATPRVRLLLGALPIALLVGLGWSLQAGAAREVRDDTTYSLLFLALGSAWMALTWKVTAWLGIDVWDDVLERNNLAACIAACGALVGSMTVYTFANLGEGPTIWTTIGPAMLGAVSTMALLGAFGIFSDVVDTITIDRDLASGIRFAGLALGVGLILGRSLAGDYVSVVGTLSDFFGQAWPALPLVAMAAWLERRLRPTPQQPRPDVVRKGFVLCFGYAAIGVLDVIYLGLPLLGRAAR
jgi:uncharacterized membrane protein YjfL (UPF0719 family)